ncbi:MAG: DUF1467 family protein [Kiloniellales bacterium]|nr:DUF1467 family protein [Kiloniellales bacterium]
MNWFSGLLTYIIIWWLVLFMVLPWGAHAPEKPEIGHAASAPEKPRLWLKAGVTTLIAGAVWLLVFLAIENSWVRIEGVN